MLYQKNGAICAQDIVSIEDRAFMYGDGCFTTARFSGGNIQLWQRHIDRFVRSITQLRLNCDIESIKKEKDLFVKQLHELKYKQGTIKILLSRGTSQRGYAIPDQNCDIYFYFYPQNSISIRPSILHNVGIINEPLGVTTIRLKGIKSLNRVEQVIFKDIATQQGWNEAICIDIDDNLVEGISSNCFLYINGCWVTPDLVLSGIDGIMRQEILSRMQTYQIDCQVRSISMSEIAFIQAGFLCNSLSPMQMIGDLMGCDLSVAPCEELFTTLFLEQLV